MLVDGGGLQKKTGHQHPDGLGAHPASSDSAVRRAVLALAAAYLSECIGKKRVSFLARFLPVVGISAR